MKILSGRKVAGEIAEELKVEIEKASLAPRLVIIQVGDNAASNKYIKFKMKKAEALGVDAVHKKYDENYSQNKLIEDIKDLAPWVDGIIVQLPLPEKFETQKILNSVPFDKDVDGLAEGNNKFIPATPRGIMTLLNRYDVQIKNKIVAVVGQSALVGAPVSDLLEAAGAKEVMRFDKSTGIKGTEKADILVVAAGEKDLIKKENIKPGVTIIDVGINTLGNGKITGDVDRESVGELPSALSPVPGGVGPMTVISLFENLLDSTK